MGNCCGGGEVEESNATTGSSKPSTKAFQGAGQRLGTTSEQTNLVPPSGEAIRRDENIPKPVHDPNLTDEQREEARKARLAAVEARLKKQGGPPKKKPINKAPLKGPNSEPLMRWN